MGYNFGPKLDIRNCRVPLLGLAKSINYVCKEINEGTASKNADMHKTCIPAAFSFASLASFVLSNSIRIKWYICRQEKWYGHFRRKNPEIVEFPNSDLFNRRMPEFLDENQTERKFAGKKIENLSIPREVVLTLGSYVCLNFDNRERKDEDSFHYLEIKNNKIRPEVD